jgi:hypothetical protein
MRSKMLRVNISTPIRLSHWPVGLCMCVCLYFLYFQDKRLLFIILYILTYINDRKEQTWQWFIFYVNIIAKILTYIFSPYLNYLNHVTKVVNSRPAVSTHQTEQLDQIKEKLDLQRLKNHQKR